MVLVFLFEDIIKAFGPLDPTVVHSAANAAGIKGANAPQSTETIGSRRRKDTSHIKVTRILQNPTLWILLECIVTQMIRRPIRVFDKRTET